ncbi:MAG: hypothetical protein KJ648_06990, partial [Candidatus Omnitrophica bacterium]|nr:hypothetical protein [Candidatus Omnitrophota bacterium]
RSDANFTIDSEGPTAPNLVTPANSSVTTETTVTFTWEASTDNLTGIGSYEINLDGTLATQDATTLYTPPYTLTQGLHTWEVRARDRAGNWGTPSASWSFTVSSEAGRPSVEVIVPNGGEEWAGGTVHNITWIATDESGIDRILIYYSTGEGWITIATNEANDGEYPWTVPSLNTAEALVRIEAVDSSPHHLVGTDESDANFTIDSQAPSIPVLVAPANGSTTIESTVTFTWEAATDNLTGIASYEINIDGALITQGATTSYTAPSALTEGLHTWEVKARDGAGNWSGNQTFTFTISTIPVVTVEAPNGGEEWMGGSSQNITWFATDEAGIDRILIYYSTGEGWITITTNEANTGSYAWTTPLISTSEARVRIEAIDSSPLHNIGTDESDADFTIDSQGPTAPNLVTPANSSVTNEATVTFTWEASTDNLTGIGSYEINIDGTLATQGATTAYTVPSALSEGLHTWEVRARDRAGNWGNASAAWTFTISFESTNPSVEVIIPNGGEEWMGGSSRNITWFATDEAGIDRILIYYSTGEGWITIATNEANDGEYPWTVPTINTAEARVRIEAIDSSPHHNIGTDESDANFIIDSIGPSAPTLVTPPNGSVTTETTPTLTWEASTDNLTGIGSYEITIDTTVVTQDATTIYTIPSALSQGTHTWEVRARDRAGNWGSASAAWTFIVSSEAAIPSVEVIVPNGGEEWAGGTVHNITWTASDESGIDEIRIYYTTGEGWVTIATNEANDGEYPWTVPTFNTSEARVRVDAVDSSPLHNIGSDESDANFTIDSQAPTTPNLVTPPNGSTTTETTVTFTWEASTDNLTGIASYEINIDGALITQGATTSYTAPSALTEGLHTWEVKARDGAGNWGNAQTFTFTISTIPVVTVEAPNGGEEWMGGSSQNITWTATDVSGIDEIRIHYTTGEGWIQIAIGEPNDGIYPWPVPTINTSEARVRIQAIDSSPLHNVGTDESDANFIIDSIGPTAPTLLTPPNGSVTDEGTVTFTWEASTDNLTGIGSYEITIDTSVVTQGATTSYTVPSALSEGLHTWEVRARDRAGNWGTPSSSWTFTVSFESTNPTVEVIIPNGGEEWMGGSSQDITWTATDASGIDHILIYYATGEGWITIATNEANDGTYTWTVPTINTSEARVRVEAVDSSQHHNIGTDESDANFTIDSTGPSTPVLVAPPNGSTTTETQPIFTWEASTDNLTGIGSYEINIDGSLITQGATTTYTPPSAMSYGAHTWRVRARDRAGNWGTPAAAWTFNITSEAGRPSVEVYIPNGGEEWMGGSTYNITWYATDESGIDSISIYYTTGEGWVQIAIGQINDGDYL